MLLGILFCTFISVATASGAVSDINFLVNGKDGKSLLRTVRNVDTVQCDVGASGTVPHPNDCERFLICDQGRTIIMECGPSTLFNPTTKGCDYPQNVVCASSNSPTTTPSVSTVVSIVDPGNTGADAMDGFMKFMDELDNYNRNRPNAIQIYLLNIKPRFDKAFKSYHSSKNSASAWRSALKSFDAHHESASSSVLASGKKLFQDLCDELDVHLNKCFLHNHMKRKESNLFANDYCELHRERFQQIIQNAKNELQKERDAMCQLKNEIDSSSRNSSK